MKLTAAQPVSQRSLGDDDFAAWAKKEGNPLLLQLRTFANQVERAAAFVTTNATGAYVTAWSEDVPDQVTWLVTASVAARAVSGGSARAGYVFAGAFYRDGGALTQQGITASLFSAESVLAFDARFNILGNTLQVQVLDDGARTVDWQAVVTVQEVH